MAKANPFRWSTQYTDDETDLVCYLHRYYNPSTGRWLSRDPIAELGGFNLYAFALNSPLNILDILGLGNYRIGSPTEPPMTFDENFVYDPNAHATAGDYASWTWWSTKALGAMILRHDLVDAVAAYRHYLDATGTDMDVDYPKAYRDDKNIHNGVNNEIAAAQADAEKLAASSGKTRFAMTGDAERLGNPSTENWQKTIGQHYIWGSADVEGCDTFTMTIAIHEKDRYNFNRGAHDIATGLPDDANGRFAVLGWAKSFITNGKVVKKVTWKKGQIGPTTKIEDPPRR
jgi:RHS repeat-associated protein